MPTQLEQFGAMFDHESCPLMDDEQGSNKEREASGDNDEASYESVTEPDTD